MDSLEWSDWCLVCSESALKAALERGYFAPDEIDEVEDSIRKEHRGLTLVRGNRISFRAKAVQEPDLELGEPVSIRWKAEYLEQMFPELKYEQGLQVEFFSGLALYSSGFKVGFARTGRRIALLTFLENRTDAECLVPSEQIDELLRDREIDSSPLSPATPRFGGIRGAKSHKKQQPKVSSQPQILGLSSDENNGGLIGHSKMPVLGRELVPVKILETLLREERLQCASELVLEVAENSEQLAFAAALAGASDHVRDQLANDLSALCKFRADKGVLGSPLVEAAQHIIGLEVERRFSPMVNEDKVKLLKLATKSWGVSGRDLEVLLHVLGLIEADESLGELDLSEMSSWVQGLVLFFMHSANPQRLLEIDRGFYGVTPIAVSISAFLVGLRFPRQLFKSDSVFMPLRDLHVRTAVEILNDKVDISKHIEIMPAEDTIDFGGKLYVPAREMQVLELDKSKIRVEVSGGNRRMFVVSRLILPANSALPTLKRGTLSTYREDLYQADGAELRRFLDRFDFTKRGSRFIPSFFTNCEDNDHLFKEYVAVKMSCVGQVWLTSSSGEMNCFESPKMLIRQSKLCHLLNITVVRKSDEEEKKACQQELREIKKKLPKSFRKERVRVPSSDSR